MKSSASIIILCVALAAVAVSVAQGSPSFRGYTGLVLIPTSDTLNKGEYNFGLMTEDTSKFEANDIFANYGPTDCLEVGIDSFQIRGADTRETLVNAKYQLMPETESKAGVAFGLIDLTDEVEATAYVVASKSIARDVNVFDNEITNVRGHIGFGGGRLNSLFVGASAFAGNRVMFSAEWDSTDVNLGFRFTPVKGLRLHAAWFDVGGGDNIGLGVSYQKNY